ncbi:hypothetical protein [Lacticaseibacillus porcinae]|uniref:hypothetical protein n=1 Tax=Lacticaseibacillus porcinae TaxID=1123687 RepID=UPI000F78E8DC|nr:hypothetical protein [Lacticaseibacillus porcinae]
MSEAMKVRYIGDYYEKGTYEVLKRYENGYFKLKGKLFEGHEILAGPDEVRPERILTDVHPIRGGFTVGYNTQPKGVGAKPEFLLYDIGAYPVIRHGYSFGDPTFELIRDHGFIKDCWNVLENYDVPGQCSETLGSGWAELEDGTIKYFPCEKYHSSALDKMPKLAYEVKPKHGHEEISLF